MTDSVERHRAARLGLAALLVAGISGCDNPDPEGRFDEFGEKTADRRGSPDIGTPDGGQQVDFSGSYFLALATTLAPTAPLYIQADVSVDTEDFTIDFTFQPLKTDMEMGMPREDARAPVGDPITVEDVPLSEGGQFDVDLGMIEVDGSANPISGGDIVASIQLQGFVLSESSWCGTATGDVTAPTMLPLAGSTFGATLIDVEDITLIDPVSQCTGGVVPGDDMGTDAGGDMGGDAGDMGPEPFVRCHPGLEGDYDFAFKADLSDERTLLTMSLTAGDGMNSPCYTGELISQSDGTTVVGNVEFLDDRDTVLTGFVPDFMIPPGATPLLPDGGVATLELRATNWTTEGACGELTFTIQDPMLSSEGDFFILRQDSADYTFDDSPTSATCNSIIPNAPCGLDAWEGTYQFKFITETTAMAGGMPTLLEMTLAPHPLTCLTGQWTSLTTEDLKLADVAFAEPAGVDQAQINIRNFVIPPDPDNPVPILANGGVADVVLDTEMATPGTSFCGSETVNLVDPVMISSDGTFAADQTEPAMASCP